MSEKLQIHAFRNPDELARAVAERWMNDLQSRDRTRPFGVALSGGRIAKTLFETIGAPTASSAEVPWTNAHFFWADERCVPPADPESNFATADKHLFKPLSISASNVHRILGEADPEWAADQAEAELCRLMPMDSSGQPVLDLVFLGMGEDGHVASLFPGESATDRETTKVYRHVIGPKPPPARITIGYPALIAARRVWILASGGGKEAAYKGLIQRDLALPVARVVEGRTQTILFEEISHRL